MLAARKRILTAWLALALALGACSPALADYRLPDGRTVHWAGGSRIVVTDRDSNVVYRGEGVWAVDCRGNSRLLPPGLSPGEREFVLRETVPATIGLCGAQPPGAGERSARGPVSYVPYWGVPDLHYSGMQPVTVTLPDGRQVAGYANVYDLERWDPEAGVWGCSAVPVTSEIGRLLKDAGFPLDRYGNWVLIHYGAPGAAVSWTRAAEAGAGFANVSPSWPDNPDPAGGCISVRLRTRARGAGGAGD